MKYIKQIYLFTLLLLSVTIYSCGKDTCSHEKEKTLLKQEFDTEITVHPSSFEQYIRVYVVDSCEYIGFSGTYQGGTSIIHKHNCKFCIERNKK